MASPPPRPRLHPPLHPQPASGLFTATLQSLTQSLTYCLTKECLVEADLHVFLKADNNVFVLMLAILFTLDPFHEEIIKMIKKKAPFCITLC